MDTVLSKFDELFIRRDLFMPIELLVFVLILIVIIPIWFYRRKKRSEASKEDGDA